MGLRMVDTVRMVRWSGTRRLRIAAIALVAAAALLSSCASTGYHYVKNSSDKTYFKVPESWKLFDQDAVLKVTGKGLSSSQLDAIRNLNWEVRFDSNPKPSLRHFTPSKFDLRYPIGIAEVDGLLQDAADHIALVDLRGLYFNIDSALQSGQGSVVTYEPVEFDGGFHGVHIVADIVDNGKPITFNEKAVLDQATSKVYAVVVFCGAKCYEDNQTMIERIINSWTIRN